MNFHLFLHLEKNLAWIKFDDDDEVQEEVNDVVQRAGGRLL